MMFDEVLKHLGLEQDGLTRANLNELRRGQKNSLDRALQYDCLCSIANPQGTNVERFANNIINYENRNRDGWVQWIWNPNKMLQFPEQAFLSVLRQFFPNNFCITKTRFQLVQGDPANGLNDITKAPDLVMYGQNTYFIVEFKANNAAFNETAAAIVEFAMIDQAPTDPQNKQFLMLTLRHNAPVSPNRLLDSFGLENLSQRTRYMSIVGSVCINPNYFGNGNQNLFRREQFENDLQSTVQDNLASLVHYLENLE